jgi:hypothetical protein
VTLAQVSGQQPFLRIPEQFGRGEGQTEGTA